MPYFKYDNKKVFYKIKGQGEPLLLLHGNTGSSSMFALILKMYVKEFQVILVDYPGHGKSDRLEKFHADFWFYNAEVCYALIKELQYDKVSVVGTSGGALVAINLALEHPQVVKCLIADSFEGEYPLKSYVNTLKIEREKDKRKLFAMLFWFFCHGFDWKKIVDLDTDVNILFSQTGKSFFHKSVSVITAPTLLTGSLKDEYCNQLNEKYNELKKKNTNFKVHLFENGNHPAMLSNKNAFFNLIKSMIKSSNNDLSKRKF